jgi:hypothetical protein
MTALVAMLALPVMVARMSERRSPVARVFLAMIGFYRRYISPLTPPSCIYSPTCSEYAMQAIVKYGAGKGSWLALKRILRCHPFHKGGFDPVP